MCLYYIVFVLFFFFFKQKTAYEMRISDWSSDVCSSDLEWPEIFGPIAISILEPVQHCLGYDVLLIILIAADPASQGVPALRNKWSRHEAGVHDPKRIPDRKSTRLNSSH